jgi:pyrimidine and pyridine-specific 5'-nucleotidase
MTPPRRPVALTGISPATSARKSIAGASKAAAPPIPTTSPKLTKTATTPPNGSASKPSVTPPNGRANKSTPNPSASHSPAGRPQRSRNGSNVSSLGPLPAVPWSSNGALGRLGAKLFADSPPKFNRAPNGEDVDYIPPPPDSRRTSTFDMSVAETRWEGPGNDDMDLEMLTEVMDGGEVDEDVSQYNTFLDHALMFPQFQAALDQLTRAHTSRLTDLKRLLEQTATASAAQLHALQAELRLLRATLEQERVAARESELRRDRERLSLATRGAEDDGADWDVARALRGDGRGNFNDADVRKAVRGLKMADRMRLCAFRLADYSLYTHSSLQNRNYSRLCVRVFHSRVAYLCRFRA